MLVYRGKPPLYTGDISRSASALEFAVVLALNSLPPYFRIVDLVAYFTGITASVEPVCASDSAVRGVKLNYVQVARMLKDYGGPSSSV